MIDGAYVVRWLVAFALTQVVEIPIYVLALRVGPLRAFGASAITHPIFWFAIAPAWRATYLALDLRWTDPPYDFVLHLAGESVAVLGEAVWFWALSRGELPWRRALLVSLVANGASFGLGLALQLTVGWP